MCTVSWQYSNQGYSVHFNRDEQKIRDLALAPRVFYHDGVKTIMPIDPVGEGTWCSANEYGFTVALLNFYQGRLPKGKLTSRGKIVKACSVFTSHSQVSAYLDELNLAKYAPFSLLSFSLEQDAMEVTVCMHRWNGKQLLMLEQKSPLISSAIDYESVHTSRIAIYERFVEESSAGDADNIFRSLHMSHLPSRSSNSICMHRDDAGTVSYSHVQVTPETVNFSYTDGAPCESDLRLHASLRLSNSTL